MKPLQTTTMATIQNQSMGAAVSEVTVTKPTTKSATKITMTITASRRWVAGMDPDCVSLFIVGTCR